MAVGVCVGTQLNHLDSVGTQTGSPVFPQTSGRSTTIFLSGHFVFAAISNCYLSRSQQNPQLVSDQTGDIK